MSATTAPDVLRCVHCDAPRHKRMIRRHMTQTGIGVGTVEFAPCTCAASILDKEIRDGVAAGHRQDHWRSQWRHSGLVVAATGAVFTLAAASLNEPIAASGGAIWSLAGALLYLANAPDAGRPAQSTRTRPTPSARRGAPGLTPRRTPHLRVEK